MKTHRFYLMIALLFVALTSCKDSGKKGILTPTSSGLPYELMLVIDDSLYEDEVGQTIREVLTTNVPGLPQPEASFKLMHIDPSRFDRMLKPIRNIVIVDIDRQQYTEARFNGAKDVYAFPQSILTIQAPDKASFIEFVQLNAQQIIDYFTKAEMNRQFSILEKHHNVMVSDKVREMFACDVWLPGELKSSMEKENFYWVGTNEGAADRYFVMYTIPYEDKDSFTQEYFIHKRDSAMQNIRGTNEETMHMMTVPGHTQTQVISVQGSYTLEARGLWQMKNDMMGGPYVSHMRLDEQNKRLVIAEVFVYAPEKMKRNLLRQLEASLYTLRLPADLAKHEANLENDKTDE